MFSQAHILIGVLIIIAISSLYFLNQKPIPNVGSVVVNALTAVPSSRTIVESIPLKNANVDDLMESLVDVEPKLIAGLEQPDQEVLERLKWKNEASGKEATNSFASGSRGVVDPSEWDSFYRTNSDQVDGSYKRDNDGFMPVDETGGNSAAYASGDKKKMTPQDLFKVDELLPQEVNKNWFEVMPEPIKIKNRHLINVTRPVGVNTIGTSLKNASYDVRGTPVNPKFVVSPWLVSTIEPDLNTKGLC